MQDSFAGTIIPTYKQNNSQFTHTHQENILKQQKARCGDPCLILALRKADVVGYQYTV